MKKTYIFCTKPWFFLSEIPPIFLLIITLVYNNDSEGLLKLYPLIAFSIGAIVLIFMYFFRMISITTEEIKCIGVFSSKDSEIINKDKSLVFVLRPMNKMVVSLRGKSTAPTFSWSNDKGADVDLFHEKAIGTNRTVKRVLSFFDVPLEDIDTLLTNESFSKEYDNYTVSKNAENENALISIKFTKTI